MSDCLPCLWGDSSRNGSHEESEGLLEASNPGLRNPLHQYSDEFIGGKVSNAVRSYVSQYGVAGDGANIDFVGSGTAELMESFPPLDQMWKGHFAKGTQARSILLGMDGFWHAIPEYERRFNGSGTQTTSFAARPAGTGSAAGGSSQQRAASSVPAVASSSGTNRQRATGTGSQSTQEWDGSMIELVEYPRPGART